MASASLFALNASSGYLSLAAASAGVRPKGRLPRPTSATAPAPCRISRRVAENLTSLISIQILLKRARCRLASQRLQEIHHRVDFLWGQDPVAPERRHHGQRIAQGFVRYDGDELRAIWIFALDVDQLRPDGAGQGAALDGMAG